MCSERMLKMTNEMADSGVYESHGALDITVTDRDFAARQICRRTPDSHKGTYGSVLSVTGSRSMPGASVMSAKAALRSGLGILRQCAVPESIAAFAAAFPEPVYVPVRSGEDGFYSAENAEMLSVLSGKSDALLIGCGLGCTDETKALVRELLINAQCPVVLDADGLNCIADNPDILNLVSQPVVITPHPAEAARLLGTETAEIQKDRLAACIQLSERFPAVVSVLKGAGTITCCGNRVYVNSTGNPGMSTGGSGDVLAGITASLLAQNRNRTPESVLRDTAAAVWIHGRAGDAAAEKLSQFSMLPSDIILALPEVFSDF